MPTDMKETIADAAKRLLMEKHVKKLTVKDIVEECQITRQAFYYHFEDIPDLFRWILEESSRQFIRKAQESGDAEEMLKCFFLMSINAAPYIRKGLQGNYREELEQLLCQNIRGLFERTIEEKQLYQQYSHSEVKLFLRYHSQAVMGILREWTEEDTRNLDQIVHNIYLLIQGKISP